MRGRANRTAEKDVAFFETLRDGRSVSAACIDAGYARSSVYEWREADSEFKARMDEAVEEGTDRLEDEAIRRARDGTERPVYQSGELVGTVCEYSDTLMIFMLKARRPQKFKDRVAVGGDADAPPVKHEHASAVDTIESKLAILAARSGEESDPRKPH